jgi:hypothetical protein
MKDRCQVWGMGTLEGLALASSYPLVAVRDLEPVLWQFWTCSKLCFISSSVLYTSDCMFVLLEIIIFISAYCLEFKVKVNIYVVTFCDRGSFNSSLLVQIITHTWVCALELLWTAPPERWTVEGSFFPFHCLVPIIHMCYSSLDFKHLIGCYQVIRNICVRFGSVP